MCPLEDALEAERGETADGNRENREQGDSLRLENVREFASRRTCEVICRGSESQFPRRAKSKSSSTKLKTGAMGSRVWFSILRELICVALYTYSEDVPHLMRVHGHL